HRARNHGPPPLCRGRSEGEDRLPRKRSRHQGTRRRQEQALRDDGRPVDEPDDPHDRRHRDAGERHQGLRPRAVRITASWRYRWWVLAALAIAASLLLTLMIGLAVSIGEIAIPVSTTARAVSNRLFATAFELNRIHEGVIWDY